MRALRSLVVLTLMTASCNSGGSPGAIVPPPPDRDMADPLQPDEVNAIMLHAAQALPESMAIAVTDRQGDILAVATDGLVVDYADKCAAQLPDQVCPTAQADWQDPCSIVDISVQLARTASFFSADQTPLSSRSVRFLSGVHFPPGIMNAAAAALFGIENTNRGCTFDTAGVDFLPDQSVPRSLNLASVLQEVGGGAPLQCGDYDDATARCGCTAGVATLPGAVPIYKNGRMVGGIGVALFRSQLVPDPVADFDDPDLLRKSDASSDFTAAEYAARAFAGDNLAISTINPKGLKNVCDPSSGIAPPACCANATNPCTFSILPLGPPAPFPLVIFIDGIEIPFVALNPGVPAPGAVPTLSYIVEPGQIAAETPPSGWLVGPNPGTSLTMAEVDAIVNASIDEATAIRAAIRLPLQARTAMVIAVSDIDANLIGLYRMNDATLFSIDVAVAKARNVIYFSSLDIQPIDALDCPGQTNCGGQAFRPGTAITNRTLGFGAQPFFPSGIEGALPGFPEPFTPGPFRRVFIDDSLTPCTNGGQPSNGKQTGIVFFPGSVPLYRDGVLIGGLGVSGDGVEQDDLVSFSGGESASGFEPPASIRADQLFVRGVRLPYLKFNRRPGQ